MPTRTTELSATAAAPVAEEIWLKCPGCKEIAFRKEVERNLNVCPKCGWHLRLTVEQRLAVTFDRGTWRELFANLTGGDPLEFTDTKPYVERLQAAQRATGRNDAVVTGVGQIEGRDAAVAIMDFNFMGGSMGVVVGDKIARLMDHALRRRLPVVVFCASGGARMQEGALSLMQMAKVSADDRAAARRAYPLHFGALRPDDGGSGRLLREPRRFEYRRARRRNRLRRPPGDRANHQSAAPRRFPDG